MKRSISVALASALFARQGQAQDALPSCAQACFLTAIAATSCGTNDAACFCSKSPFLSDFEACAGAACFQADQQNAFTFVDNLCRSAGVTVTVSSIQPTSAGSQSATSTSGGGGAGGVAAGGASGSSGSSSTSENQTVLTTTGAGGSVYTLTELLIVSGNSTSTVPFRTMVATASNGSVYTSTVTGAAALPSDLQNSTSSAASNSSASITSMTSNSPSRTAAGGGASSAASSSTSSAFAGERMTGHTWDIAVMLSGVAAWFLW